MTYLLDGSRAAAIARRPVTVTVTGAGASDVIVRAEGESEVRTGRPHVLVLTRTTGPTTVWVAAAAGRAAFPPNTVVSLTVRTDAVDDEAVVLPSVDVSGGADRELVTLDVLDDDHLSIVAVEHVREPPLGPLAAAARARARGRLGTTSTSRSVALGVAVDLSTSMATALVDGSVEAVVEVVVGLSHVVGGGRDVAIDLIGIEPRRLPAAPPEGLGRFVADEAAAAGAVIGFRAASAPPPGPGPSVSVVVTDAVPADVAALRAAAAGDRTYHLVVVGHEGPPDPRPHDVPATFLASPMHPDGTVADLLAEPAILGELVDALTGGLAAGRGLR